jgi:hypothetical protein
MKNFWKWHNSIQQSTFWEADSSLVGQEITPPFKECEG